MAIYGYRDITDCTLTDLSTGKTAILLDYLSTSSQTYGSEVIYASAGRGNSKRVAFQATNNLDMELKSGLITPELLGLMLGVDVVTGVQIVPITDKITTLTNSFTLTAATPYITDLVNYPINVAFSTDGTAPKTALTKDVSATPATGAFYISGNTITVNATDYPTGGTFIVTYSKQSTAANKRVQFQADKYAKTYKLTGMTLWKNEKDGLSYPCRITIPKLQILINGAVLNSAVTGAATEPVLKATALTSSTSKVLITYDIEESEGMAGY